MTPLSISSLYCTAQVPFCRAQVLGVFFLLALLTLAFSKYWVLPTGKSWEIVLPHLAALFSVVLRTVSVEHGQFHSNHHVAQTPSSKQRRWLGPVLDHPFFFYLYIFSQKKHFYQCSKVYNEKQKNLDLCISDLRSAIQQQPPDCFIHEENLSLLPAPVCLRQPGYFPY